MRQTLLAKAAYPRDRLGGRYTLISPASFGEAGDHHSALAQARDRCRLCARAQPPGGCRFRNRNNGSAQLYFGSYCPSELGRLPWRTLGLPDPRDGSGERLWYAVSRDYSRNPAGAPPLNSDTPGPLTVTGTAPANDVIAIVFAPGAVVGNQPQRSGQTWPKLWEGGNDMRRYLLS